MAQRVTVVQDFAEAGLLEVLGNDFSLHGNRAFNELPNYIGSRIHYCVGVLFHEVEDCRVSDEAALDDLGHP